MYMLLRLLNPDMNPDEITIADFAEEIIKLTGTTQKVIDKLLGRNER